MFALGQHAPRTEYDWLDSPITHLPPKPSAELPYEAHCSTDPNYSHLCPSPQVSGASPAEGPHVAQPNLAWSEFHCLNYSNPSPTPKALSSWPSISSPGYHEPNKADPLLWPTSVPSNLPQNTYLTAHFQGLTQWVKKPSKSYDQ